MSAPVTKATVAVIVPFYKGTLTDYEAIALEQCFKILKGRTIIAIKPHELTLPAEVTKYPFTSVMSFGDYYFKSVEGYNALMLSDVFYKEFLACDFMLIHQLDAFVFADKLDHWCAQKWDYIGAPWLKDIEHGDLIKKVKSKIYYYYHTRYDVHINGAPSKYQYENRVGNGGFSLRRTQKFYDVCVQWKAIIDEYLSQDGHHYNEDRFWSIEVNRKHKRNLTIPNYKTGVQFAFEFAPWRAVKLNNGQLPFGCHAWDRYLDFWRPVFKEQGYTI
jgi:hypothetical protein